MATLKSTMIFIGEKLRNFSLIFLEQSSVGVLELVHQQAEKQKYVIFIRPTVNGENLDERT